MQSATRAAAGIIADPGSGSIKRLAWAFGCAKKGSDEEVELYRILVERMAALKAAR